MLILASVALTRPLLPNEYNVTHFSGANNTCHPGLLDSYLLPPRTLPTNKKNFLCNGITNNCCGVSAQIKIFKRWSGRFGAKTTVRFYQRFIYLYSRLFDLLARVEGIAKGIKDASPPGTVNNCLMIANTTLQLQASSMKGQVLADFERAFKFLYAARRGFYCQLCDSNALAFILPESGVLKVSRGFCSSLVGETMNAMSFKYEYLQKIARLYGTLAKSCSSAGVYNPRSKLKRAVMFFTNKRIVRDIVTCKSNIKSDATGASCSRYCERFNPARFGRMFEGQFRRTAIYVRWLRRRVRMMTEPTGPSKNLEDLDFKGRILQTANSTNASSAKPGNATNTSRGSAKRTPVVSKKRVSLNLHPVAIGVNEFNSNYSTQLVVPLSFRPSDLPRPRRGRVGIRQSMFRLKKNALFNVGDFKVVVSALGMNPIKYGHNTFINPKSYQSLMRASQRTSAPNEAPSSQQSKQKGKTKGLRNRKV